MAPKKSKRQSGDRPVATNRKARHDYEILETFECGIALVGSEVKSLRAGKVQLRDAYARVQDGEVWLHGVHIAPYEFAHGPDAHDPDRRRKLLLHRREIDRLAGRVQEEGLTLVPLDIHFRDRYAKVTLALARGRKRHDKREAIAARDAGREVARALASQRRYGDNRRP